MLWLPKFSFHKFVSSLKYFIPTGWTDGQQESVFLWPRRQDSVADVEQKQTSPRKSLRGEFLFPPLLVSTFWSTLPRYSCQFRFRVWPYDRVCPVKFRCLFVSLCGCLWVFWNVDVCGFGWCHCLDILKLCVLENLKKNIPVNLRSKDMKYHLVISKLV